MTISKKHENTLSNLEKRLLLGGLLIFIASCFWLLSLLDTYESIIDRLPNHTEESREYAEVDIDNAVRGLAFEKDVTPTIYQQARDEYADNVNDFIKDKRGLNAQEGMWKAATELLRFTAYQLFFLVLTTLVSGVGIYLLYKTLKATQEANANTEKNLKAERDARILELRPYISIDDVNVTIIPPTPSVFDRDSRIKFTFTLTNNGQTPVKEAQIHAHAGKVSIHLASGGDPVEIPLHIIAGQVVAMIQINPRSTVRASLALDAPINVALTEPRNEIDFTIESSVKFKDLGTDRLENMHRRIKFKAIGSDRLIDNGDSVTVKYWREVDDTDGNNSWISSKQ